jgi:hypothetical protein
MPYITVGEHPKLLAKSVNTAPGRAVIALQAQTGKKLAELREEIPNSESLNNCVVAFLSLQTAGIFETWEQLLERPFEDIEFELTEKEIRENAEEKEAEDEEEAGPTQPSTGSPPDDSAALAVAEKLKSPKKP